MNAIEAAKIVAEEVGLSFVSVESIDQICREAASARLRGDWGKDCQWRSFPHIAAKRVTIYLDSFIDPDVPQHGGEPAELEAPQTPLQTPSPPTDGPKGQDDGSPQ